MIRRPVHTFADNTLGVQFSVLVASRLDLVNGTIEDIHGAPASRIFFPPSAIEIEIVALPGGEANTAAGTGVQSVRIWTLGPAYEYTENVVTLNGTTPVAIPGGPYLRCNFLESETVGSDDYPAGAPVIVRATVGGEVLRRLPVGNNRSQDGGYTVPGDEIMKMASLLFALEDQQRGDIVRGFVEFRRSPLSPWIGADTLHTLAQLDPATRLAFPVPLALPARTDMRFSALATAQGVDIAAQMVFLF